MILVDTSVWVDHFRKVDETLSGLLGSGEVLAHRLVIAELALGNLRQRQAILSSLQDLPQSIVASDEEILNLIERHALAGAGIGYVDVHLLASAQLTPDASLWTRDKRLLGAARKLGLAAAQA